MKNNVKALIACGAALLLAGGGYAALMLTDDKNEDSSSSAVTEETEAVSVPVPVLEFEKGDIEAVTVKNADGEFMAVPLAETDEIHFTIKGFEDLDVNTGFTDNLLSSSAGLTSDSTVEENPSDLEKYGLKNPRAEVTVRARSGQKTILVGNESPVKGETYFMEKDGSTVYLGASSSLSIFLNNAEYYISTTLLEALDEESSTRADEIIIERTDLDYDIVLEYDKSADDEDTKSGTLATHYMTKPVFAYLDSEKSQTAVSGFFGLNAQSVMTAHPTDDEIKASGLDEPFCTVTMKTNESEEYILKLGNKLESDAGAYYLAMFNDNDVIYAISADSVCWAELEPGDITSKMVFGTYVWDIGKLKVSVKDGETVTFEGNGSSEDDYKVTKNGKTCDTERFRSFYTFLLKTSAEDFVIDEQPTGEPIVTIELETQDGKTKQTVEFYKTEGKKALISVNGTPCFKCRMSYVELLTENLGKFDSEEEFVMNW